MHGRNTVKHDVNTVKFSDLYFDDEIQGKFVSASYTHHEPMENGKIGQPKFLALKEDGKPCGFYLIGFKDAVAWVKEVDANLSKRKSK